MKFKYSGEVVEMIGDEPGSTSMILVGVHGNETCGPLAMDFILPSLKIQKGRLLIAYANPLAILRGVRQTDQNLNRLFRPLSTLSHIELRSYEFQRALYLKTFLDQCDVLLDVHASSNPESKQFIIAERNSDRITDLLPIKTVVYGFDTVEPGGTDYYMNSIGKIGICVECGVIGSDKALDTAVQTILTFLIVQGHILGDAEKTEKERMQMYDLYLTKTDSFKLRKKLPDFAEIKKGQVIGRDGKVEVKAPKDGIILFAHNREQKGAEAFLLGTKVDQ